MPLRYTFINSRVTIGIVANLYKDERTGEYIVTVWARDSKGAVDHTFAHRSKAVAFRENLRSF